MTHEQHELIGWAEGLIEQERSALETGETDGDRRRGRIDAYRQLIAHVKGPDPRTVTPSVDYGFGQADAAMPY